MKLGILLARDPLTYQDAHTALHVAESALERGDEVKLFLLDEAVALADSRLDKRVNVKLQSLIERGLEAYLCQHNAEERGVEEHVMEDIELSSTASDNRRMVKESDRYLAFT